MLVPRIEAGRSSDNIYTPIDRKVSKTICVHIWISRQPKNRWRDAVKSSDMRSSRLPWPTHIIRLPEALQLGDLKWR